MVSPSRLHATPRGFTLTELAIVLGVIGLLLGAIWAAASVVYDNNRATRATQQVLQIIGNFKGVYGNRPVDTGNGFIDITGMAVSNSLLPADMLPPGIYCSGASSGSCNIQPVGPWSGSTVLIYGYQPNNGILIQYSNLSQSACNRLVNNVANGTPGLIYYNISNNNSAIGPGATVTTANANAYCVNSNGNFVQVMYSMGS